MASKVLALFLAASLLVLGVATAARTRPVAAMSATAPGKCGVSTTISTLTPWAQWRPSPRRSRWFLAFNLLLLGMASDAATCPRDAVQLGACAKALVGLVDVKVGDPPVLPCCPLVAGIVDAEAAACLCTVIKGNTLGVHLDLPVDPSIVFNNCGRPGPFKC
nr:putative lipid-binding protein AIR1 [Setaria viridis]